MSVRARLRLFRQQVPWGALAIEVFSIVLGVLIALGANELRQSWATEARVAQAMTAIEAEMQENRGVLETRLAAHRRLQSQIDSALTALQQDDPGWAKAMATTDFGFIGLSDAAMRAAQQEGLYRHLAVDESQRLTAFLQLVDTAGRLREYIREQAVRINVYAVARGEPLSEVGPTYNALSHMQSYLRDLIRVEEQMLELVQ